MQDLGTRLRETLGNPARLRENESVMAGQNWFDWWQAARLFRLRADHGQEALKEGAISSSDGIYFTLVCADGVDQAALAQSE
jgi:hypothetical protein